MSTEPLEIYHDEVWEILDPNTAQLVAVFYDEHAAQEYLAWRNHTTEKETTDDDHD